MPKLILVDGHSLAYRAFYALPTDLATKAGTVTNAVYGFTSMLIKVLGDEHPDFVAVAFDAPGPTFRDAMDADYKAGRQETPAVFSAQLPLVREVLDTLCIPVLTVDGVEADDVIATLATRADDGGLDVIVVTGDRDTFQLVHDPHVRVLYNKRGVSDYALYDEAGILERTGGVTPEQYPDYAALRGDTSDNLPGVPGVGEKTAAKLVTTYGSVEGILEHLDELPPKQRQNLEAMRERVRLNRAMSVLRRDVDIGLDVTALRPATFDREQARVLFDQLEFRTLWPRLLEALGDTAVEASAETLDVEVETLRTPADAAARLRALATAGRPVALEARWDGVPGRTLAALAVADAEQVAVLDVTLLGDGDVAAAARVLVGDGGAPLVVHRAKELMHGLADDLPALRADTALMAYLLDPAEGKYRLEDLALRYLSLEVHSPDQPDSGATRPRRARRRRRDRPAGRDRPAPRRRPAGRARRARAHRPLRAHRASPRAGPGEDGGRRHPRRPGLPRRPASRARHRM